MFFYGLRNSNPLKNLMEVEVVETVYTDNLEGRIRFQGTTWAATSMDRTIPAGAKARLAYRENTSWVIESVEPY